MIPRQCRRAIKKMREELDKYAEYCAGVILPEDVRDHLAIMTEQAQDQYIAFYAYNISGYYGVYDGSIFSNYCEESFRQTFANDVELVVGGIMALGRIDRLIEIGQRFINAPPDGVARQYFHHLLSAKIAKKIKESIKGVA